MHLKNARRGYTQENNVAVQNNKSHSQFCRLQNLGIFLIRFGKKGFTLIELLVVVLIIGILAAVALPQYQKAVDRTRAAETVQLIATLQQATEHWILEHPGVEADLLYKNASEHLNIDLPCQYSNESDSCIINNADMHIEIYGKDADLSAVAYAYHLYGNDPSIGYTWIGALRDQNGIWTHKCGYFDKRGKSVCEGLQGYEAEEGFEI